MDTAQNMILGADHEAALAVEDMLDSTMFVHDPRVALAMLAKAREHLSKSDAQIKEVMHKLYIEAPTNVQAEMENFINE